MAVRVNCTCNLFEKEKTVNSFTESIRKAHIDFRQAIAKRRLWFALAKYDIKGKYRRSVLGPWWLTLSMAVLIAGLGPLYGALFNINLAKFIPFVALGMIFWTFLSAQITESSEVFISASHILKQTKLPFTLFIFRLVMRHLLIFSHNILVFVVVWLIYQPPTSLYSALHLIPALLIVSGGMFGMALTLGVLCTRYRDLSAIVANVTTVLFFLSPVIWSLEQLPRDRQFLALFNPFYYYLEITRQPLLGTVPDLSIWIGAMSFTGVCLAIGCTLFCAYRKRIAYWL